LSVSRLKRPPQTISQYDRIEYVSEPLLRVGVDASPLASGRTGVGNYVFTLLQAMCEQYPQVKFTLFGNTSAIFSDMPNVADRTAPSKLRGPLWHTLELGRVLRKNEVQAFWGTNGYLPPYKLHGIATVVTVHDLAEAFVPHTQARLVKWSRRLFQPRAVRVADRVIAVSEATAADIKSVYGRKVDAVIHPLLSPRFQRVTRAQSGAILAKYNLPENFLLTVGTLEPRKNLPALITAYIDRRKRGVGLPLLVLVGGDGWRDGSTQAMVSHAEQSGWVRRLGFVPNDDMPALYAKCEVFLMPSIYEGFGMPLVEAQLCGAPVVHGSHVSMAEAAGGFGVPVRPSEGDLGVMFDALASGRCALTCRLPQFVENDPTLSAKRLWQQLSEATSIAQCRSTGSLRVSG
jgi:glycosyltransferase involved in cell wall biosynthesis